MNKFISFLFLFILPSFLFSQNSWEKIGGKEIQLTAEIYGLTEQTVDTLYLAEAPVLVHSWLGQPQDTEHPVMVYQVNSSRYPATYVDSDSSFQLIEGFLNSTILNILEDTEYELLSSGLIFKNGYPGKEFKFKNLKNNTLREINTYLFHNQLVELTAISRSDNWFSNSKNRFLESIELLGRGENKIDYGIPIIKSDAYTVSFPETPEITNAFTEREEGYVNSKMKMVEKNISEGVVVFITSQAKFPENFSLNEEGLDSFYDESMNGSIQSMNGKFISKRQVTLDGVKGLEFYGSIYEGAAKSCFRIFFQNGTLFSIGVLFIGEELTEEGETFFDSFKIIAK